MGSVGRSASIGAAVVSAAACAVLFGVAHASFGALPRAATHPSEPRPRPVPPTSHVGAASEPTPTRPTSPQSASPESGVPAAGGSAAAPTSVFPPLSRHTPARPARSGAARPPGRPAATGNHAGHDSPPDPAWTGTAVPQPVARVRTDPSSPSGALSDRVPEPGSHPRPDTPPAGPAAGPAGGPPAGAPVAPALPAAGLAAMLGGAQAGPRLVAAGLAGLLISISGLLTIAVRRRRW